MTLLKFTSVLLVCFHCAYGHYFTIFPRRRPPPIPGKICYIDDESRNFVRVGETFTNRKTCEVRECILEEGKPTLHLLKKRKIYITEKVCQMKKLGSCLKPGQTWTDRSSCEQYMCTDSANLISQGKSNDCKALCLGCLVVNGEDKECIQAGKWHVFPTGQGCRRARCTRTGKLRTKSRPARAWKPSGNKCVRLTMRQWRKRRNRRRGQKS